MTEPLPNRIREIRLRSKMTLEAVAERAGTSKSQIEKLETGKRRLTVEWMFRLAKALHCHPAEFLPIDLDDARTQTDQWLNEFGITVRKVGNTLNIASSENVLVQFNATGNQGQPSSPIPHPFRLLD